MVKNDWNGIGIGPTLIPDFRTGRRLLALLLLLALGCSAGKPRGVRGLLEISFRFNPVEGITPSYQTAIWLEDASGGYLADLFVSEFLAYGGFNDSRICRRWPGRQGWNEQTPEQFDAVTGATPSPGVNQMRFDVSKIDLPPGRLRVCLEVHLVAEENILYVAELPIGGSAVSASGKVVPQDSSLASRYPIVTDFVVRYKPE